MSRLNMSKLFLLLISFFHAQLLVLVSSQTIAPSDDTSELMNSRESALTELAKYNASLGEQVIALNPYPKDCIFVKTEEGIYTFQSDGNSNIICGLYLISKPDYQIELEFLHFDVSCSKKGLLSVIDGWELNGQFFPGIEDHPVPRNARYHEFCGHIKPRKTFLMSQNVGLLEYRIPTAGQGFAVRVRFVQNPKPCNAVIQDVWGIHTIRNYGRRVNCTVSIIFEASFQILSMNIGHSYRPLGNLIAIRNYVFETGLIKKCKKRGMQDYVELRGGNGLDPHRMSVAEDMCGVRTLASYKKKFAVTCPHTAVRLVSSGHYDNLIEFGFSALDTSPVSSLVCSSSSK